MNVIVIPVGPGRPEDEILNLVDSFKALFPDEPISVSDALVIETENAQAAAIFKKIAGTEFKGGTNQATSRVKKYKCLDCGAPASKPNSRCKSCGMKLVGLKNRKNGSTEAAVSLAEEA